MAVEVTARIPGEAPISWVTTGAGEHRPLRHCSFCGKNDGQVTRIISGPGEAFICNECVGLCREILDEESVPSTPTRLTFEELRLANVLRCEGSFHPVNAWTLTDWMTAAAGELGEAANLIKKLRRLETGGGSETVSRAQGDTDPGEIRPLLGRELADTVIYLDLLAARAGIDLGAAVREKFNIVSERVGSKVTL